MRNPAIQGDVFACVPNDKHVSCWANASVIVGEAEHDDTLIGNQA